MVVISRRVPGVHQNTASTSRTEKTSMLSLRIGQGPRPPGKIPGGHPPRQASTTRSGLAIWLVQDHSLRSDITTAHAPMV